MSWREKRFVDAGILPKAIKHGIAITALFPESEPDYAGVAQYHVDASKGLELYTWKEAVTQEEIVPVLNGLLNSEFFPIAGDHFRAFGQACFASGIVVYVQPNMAIDDTFIEERLVLDTMVPTTSGADIVVVILKEGAKLDLVSNVTGGGEGSVFSRTLVVVTERDTQVRITEGTNLATGGMLMKSARAIVAGNSKVTWREIFSGDALTSTINESLLIGVGARATVLQGVVGEAHAIHDIEVSARHLADDTHSSIRTAGIACDTSRTLYRGLVDMKEGVHKVVGAQDGRFLVLSKGAKVDAIPALDIASNDVTCAHKLSISHIRDGDIFYPKLRGLSDDESRALFLEGHFAQAFVGDANTDIMLQVTEKLATLQSQRIETTTL